MARHHLTHQQGLLECIEASKRLAETIREALLLVEVDELGGGGVPSEEQQRRRYLNQARMLSALALWDAVMSRIAHGYDDSNDLELPDELEPLERSGTDPAALRGHDGLRE
jgi:hypothetical protein